MDRATRGWDKRRGNPHSQAGELAGPGSGEGEGKVGMPPRPAGGDLRPPARGLLPAAPGAPTLPVKGKGVLT